MLEDEPDEGARHAALLLLQLRELLENARAHAAVGVGDGQPRRVRRDARRTRSTGCPRSCAQARWLLKERDEVLERAEREADRIIEAARVRAERMVERTEVVREARRAAEDDHRARPTARPRRSATRPRTTSTASSPRSRSCSTARCSRCRRAGSGCRCTSPPRRIEPDADDDRRLLRPGRVSEPAHGPI